MPLTLTSSILALLSATTLLPWLQQLDSCSDIQLLHSCSTIYNCFLLPVTYSTRVPSFRLPLKHCWNLLIFSPPSFYFLPFNITGGNLYCLLVMISMSCISKENMCIADMLSWFNLIDEKNFQTKFEHVSMISFSADLWWKGNLDIQTNGLRESVLSTEEKTFFPLASTLIF